jgi:hypothetical protein
MWITTGATGESRIPEHIQPALGGLNDVISFDPWVTPMVIHIKALWA